jgi:hypothetical protein
MAHCAGSNYTQTGSGLWYKFVHTSAKDDTRCVYCYNKLVALHKINAHGMEQYFAKTTGKINCDTYRRDLSKMRYNDVVVSITSLDGSIPYISYNKETYDMEKHGIYCVEMANNTMYKITINVKDYLYKYVIKTANSTSVLDPKAYYTDEQTLDLMTSNCEPIAIIVFKYTKSLQLTSAATIVIKTIPSNPLLDANYLYKSQELLLSNKIDRLNKYLANAALPIVEPETKPEPIVEPETKPEPEPIVKPETKPLDIDVDYVQL